MFNRLASIFAAVLGSRLAQQEVARPEPPRLEEFRVPMPEPRSYGSGKHRRLRSRRGVKRLGRPTPCPRGSIKPWLTYAQHDHLVRLKGAIWTRQHEAVFGGDFTGLLALAEKRA